MKLDKFAIIDALESGKHREAVQVLFHHFRLGEVPGNLQIVRCDSPLMQMDYYNVYWYEWTARNGFRKGMLAKQELCPPLAKIRSPG